MWNYRLCKKTHRGDTNDPNKVTCVSYEIHEAYYNKDGSVWAITEDPVTVGSYLEFMEEIDEIEAEKLAELGKTLDWMRLALDKEIIDLDTYVFAQPDDGDDEEDEDDDEFIESDVEEESEDD